MNKAIRIRLLVKNMLGIFFGKKNFEQVKKKSKKSIAWAFIYRTSQWGLIFLTGFLVTTLKRFYAVEYFEIFGLLFMGNTLIMGSVVVLNNHTETDFTFMEGLRNVLKEAFKYSFLIGCLFEISVFLILLIWSGADQFVIFFEERFSSNFSKIFTFLLVSCCSMAIWTFVYLGFATGFWNLMEKLYA